jgi:hypothetical protein
MKWSEIKEAVEKAGIKDNDEIFAIDCIRNGTGSKTIVKVPLGNSGGYHLFEDINEELLPPDEKRCQRS